MSLKSQTDAVSAKAAELLPAQILNVIVKEKEQHMKSFDPSSVNFHVGEALPAFTLPNAIGKEVSSADLLAKGPLLITFYRGEWCPYCNLILAALQKRIGDFAARGVSLVAISPQLPNASLSTAEKNALKFEVLSDVGNVFARKLGIVWQQSNDMRAAFDTIGHDLKRDNGDDSHELPVPTTLLLDTKGVVRNIHIDADWSQRLEPQVALDWVDAL